MRQGRVYRKDKLPVKNKNQRNRKNYLKKKKKEMRETLEKEKKKTDYSKGD